MDGILDNVYDKDGNVYEWVRESENVFNFSDEKPLRKDVIFEWPVLDTNKNKIATMTAGFTEKRNKMTTFHNAIDIAAVKDTAVYVTYSGKVIFVTSEAQWCYDCYGPRQACSCGKRFGNHVSILAIINGEKYIIRYSHLNQINRDIIEIGETVEAGMLLGTIGSTGSSQGYHLDYSINEVGNAFIEDGDDAVTNIYIDPILFDSKQSRYDILEVNMDLGFYTKLPLNLVNICGGTEDRNGNSVHCEPCDDYFKAIQEKYKLVDEVDE